MRRSLALLTFALPAVLCTVAVGQGIDELIEILRGDDEVARMTARRQLAEVGPPAVMPLLGLVTEDDPKVEQTARQTLRTLVFRWSNTEARRGAVARPLLDAARGTGPPVSRRLVLGLLGMAADERVTPEIANLLSDPEVRFEAVRALQHIPHTDPTAALAVALPKADPELQVAILHALGTRADRRSTSDVTAMLASDDVTVRTAAASALGMIADPEALPALLAAARDENAGLHRAALDACLRIAGRLRESGEENSARKAFESVLRLAGTDAGIVGALTGLGQVATVESAEPIKPFLQHESRAVRVAAVTALGAVPGTGGTTALAGSLRTAGPYVVTAGLQVLGERGDAAALAVVRDLAADEERDVRLSAIWALGQLGIPAAAEGIAPRLRSGDEEERTAAQEAYLHLAGDLAGSGKREAARELYEALVWHHLTDDEGERLAWLDETGEVRRRALQGLSQVGSAESLKRLKQELERGDVLAGPVEWVSDEDVLDAYVGVCARLVADGKKAEATEALRGGLTYAPQLRGGAFGDLEADPLQRAWGWRSRIADLLHQCGDAESAKRIYRRALSALPAGEQIEAVAQKLIDMGEPVNVAEVQGFVRKWHVVGPFPNEDWGAWDTPFPPEEKVDVAVPVAYEGQELSWQEQTTDNHLSLIGPFGGIPQTDGKACYAYAQFVVDEAQPIILKMGSDDALQVWLNGELVHSNRIDRGAEVDQDVVAAAARAGVNELLCKVYNNFGGWGLIVRLCDEKGRALRFRQDIGGGGEARIPFEKVQLADGSSLVECCTVLDVDKDGRLDIASGGFWYEAPEWTPHEYREMTNDGNYANDWAEFALDINGDGWTDIVSGGFHTEEVSWYENPRGEEGMWPKHLAWSRGTEFYETLVMVDVDGDGQGDFVPNAGAPIRWYEVVRTDDGPQFVRHDIGGEGAGHGIGYGDVNRDGRTDMLTPSGWYEAPEDRREGEWAWHADWNIGSVSVPILAADLTGDRKIEIVWGGGHGYGLFLLAQEWFGGGPYADAVTIGASFSQAHAPELGDIDGDGDLDIVLGKRWKAHCGKDPGTDDPLYVYWFEFDRETGEWRRWVVSYDDGAGIGLQQSLVDIDGDGDLDIVSACKAGLHLFENKRVP